MFSRLFGKEHVFWQLAEKVSTRFYAAKIEPSEQCRVSCFSVQQVSVYGQIILIPSLAFKEESTSFTRSIFR